MAGKGRRFDQYLIPKPLMEIEGKSMIEHVVDMYPRNSEFIFICHQDHLKNTPLRKLLTRISPGCTIVSVDDKLLGGPAVTVTAAFEHIKDDEEVIVNYCDFVQIWNFDAMMKRLRDVKPAGAIMSFRGFQPSSLGSTYYAYLRVNENDFVTELREKQSFSEDRTKDFASTGTYYFGTGNVFKKYVSELIKRPELAVNGEFYMSLPYVLMMKDNLSVLNHEVSKFICFGTPRDYELYKFWSEFFLKYSPTLITFDNVNINVTNIFPLAGGARDFKELGFDGPNFMLPLMNKNLAYYSFKTNPKGVKNIFIGLDKERAYFEQADLFKDHNSEVIMLDEVKNGNAASIYEIRDRIAPDAPVCVSGATYLLEYNERKLAKLMEQEDIDIILFSFTHHECVLRNPEMFAYARTKNNVEVAEIVEKQTISSSPYRDQALTGTAIFKKAKDLFDSIGQELAIRKDGKAYFLSSVNHLLGKKKVVIFEVDKFIPIRTITNYKEFAYWQDYFDALPYHPYSKILQ
jgi:NDP-sugar pyrophosphorylase family protein